MMSEMTAGLTTDANLEPAMFAITPEESLARRAMSKMPLELSDDGLAMEFDPATIMIIIQIAQTVLPMIAERCNKDAAEMATLAAECKDCTDGRLTFRERRKRRRNRAAVRMAIVDHCGGRAAYRDAGGEDLLTGCIACAADPESGDEMAMILRAA